MRPESFPTAPKLNLDMYLATEEQLEHIALAKHRVAEFVRLITAGPDGDSQLLDGLDTPIPGHAQTYCSFILEAVTQELARSQGEENILERCSATFECTFSLVLEEIATLDEIAQRRLSHMLSHIHRAAIDSALVPMQTLDINITYRKLSVNGREYHDLSNLKYWQVFIIRELCIGRGDATEAQLVAACIRWLRGNQHFTEYSLEEMVHEITDWTHQYLLYHAQLDLPAPLRYEYFLETQRTTLILPEGLQPIVTCTVEPNSAAQCRTFHLDCQMVYFGPKQEQTVLALLELLDPQDSERWFTKYEVEQQFEAQFGTAWSGNGVIATVQAAQRRLYNDFKVRDFLEVQVLDERVRINPKYRFAETD